MKQIEYDRQKAYNYAKKWALQRNPQYYNFDPVGGDCTNFISQCIYEGSKVMNYQKENGWYYIDGNQKSPSWSGVEFLYQFLISNKTVGPYGIEVTSKKVKIGDIAQLSFDGKTFSHTLLMIKPNQNDEKEIQIASHTYDTFGKRIGEYTYKKIRFLHIKGIRKY